MRSRPTEAGGFRTSAHRAERSRSSHAGQGTGSAQLATASQYTRWASLVSPEVLVGNRPPVQGSLSKGTLEASAFGLGIARASAYNLGVYVRTSPSAEENTDKALQIVCPNKPWFGNPPENKLPSQAYLLCAAANAVGKTRRVSKTSRSAPIHFQTPI